MIRSIVTYLLLLPIISFAQLAKTVEKLSPWQEGYLDIHHINTGRGNACFIIMPDTTTMLIDAGELSPLDARTFSNRNAAIKPDSSLKPFQWIAHYITTVFPGNKPIIDYALITHFHDDHFGAWYPTAPKSSNANYLLTGITGVGELIPINRLLDRGYPRYDYPFDMKSLAAKFPRGEIEFGKTMDNYFAFQSQQLKRGMKIESLRAGSATQISLVYQPKAFPTFYIQNLKSNQYIWSGRDSSFSSHFPQPDSERPNTWPDENSLSLALILHYGNFTYYTGGDNPGNIFPGDNPLRNVETEMARVTGEVDVATMDHHGNRDAVNETQVKTLRPRIWIGQSWSADHPGHEVLIRLTSTVLYPEQRDLFATNMLESNRLVIGPLIDNSYKSQQGHVLIRVLPEGKTYYVIILDDTNVNPTVKAVFGPYESKKLQTTK